MLPAVVAHHSVDCNRLCHFRFLRYIVVYSAVGGCKRICRFAVRRKRFVRQFDRPLFRFSLFVYIEEIQAQRVCDDAKARQTHRRRAEHRIQRDAERGVQNARCNGNADDVVAKRPKKIFFDVRQNAARQVYRSFYIRKRRLHEHDIGRIEGDIGSGSDRDADIRPRQSGSVVYTVADHCDTSVCLKTRNNFVLSVGKHVRHDRAYADRLCNRPRGTAIVAREHDDGDAFIVQSADRFGAVGFCNVGYGYDAERFSVFGKIERRLPLFGKGFAPFF